jgi:hypothetical protein
MRVRSHCDHACFLLPPFDASRFATITNAMIIPINHPASTSSKNGALPPQLAKLSGGEVVLIELQGAFEVDGDRAGQSIGTLSFTNPVSHYLVAFAMQII